MSMRAFRADDLHVERKGDGTALTQADGAIEAMARAKVAASGVALDVFGEEMGTGRKRKSVGPSAAVARPDAPPDHRSRSTAPRNFLVAFPPSARCWASSATAKLSPASPARPRWHSLVGLPRRRRLSQRTAHPRLRHRATQRSDGLHHRHRPQQECRRPRTHPPPLRRFPQLPRPRRLLAAHAGSRRCHRRRSGLDVEALGPRAARHHRRRSRRSLHQPGRASAPSTPATTSARTAKSTTKSCDCCVRSAEALIRWPPIWSFR